MKMGSAYYSLEQYQQALENYENSLKIYLKVHAEKHLDTAFGYEYVGNASHHLGENQKACENYEESL